MLESIPENLDILNEGIDIEILKEYTGYSRYSDKGKLSNKETINWWRALIEKKLPIDARKKILDIIFLFCHS